MIDQRVSPIWQPIIYFGNLMKKEETKFYGATESSTLMYFHNENELLYAESFLLKFSCEMDFNTFPFDSHNCCLNYYTTCKFIDSPFFIIFYHGKSTFLLIYILFYFFLILDSAKDVTLQRPTIIYSESKIIKGDVPMTLTTLPFPYDIQLKTKKPFLKFNPLFGGIYGTGMCMKLTRTDRGHLYSAYYYPTTAFALLSMISYLINPDIVRIV